MHILPGRIRSGEIKSEAKHWLANNFPKQEIPLC
jgi:hypothetical protein